MVADLRVLLGVAIKIERGVQGISQEELAERSGLHRSYVSDLERGARNPSITSIEKLAQALKLSVPALFQRAGRNVGAGELVEILLVEDNPRDVQLTICAFERARIINPLHVVGDGVQALDFLFATGAYLHRSYAALPQVILLELDLPRKSGLEVLKRIKADELTREIAVIVLTVSDRSSDMMECRRLGVESYIVKPIGFQNFSKVAANLSLAWTLVRPTETEMAHPVETER
jgi:CheY-like chemotaxis protein